MQGIRQGKPTLLSVKEVSGISPLPRTTIYEMARRGDIPGTVYFGRRVLFDEDKICKWIEDGGTRRGCER